MKGEEIGAGGGEEDLGDNAGWLIFQTANWTIWEGERSRGCLPGRWEQVRSWRLRSSSWNSLGRWEGIKTGDGTLQGRTDSSRGHPGRRRMLGACSCAHPTGGMANCFSTGAADSASRVGDREGAQIQHPQPEQLPAGLQGDLASHGTKAHSTQPQRQPWGLFWWSVCREEGGLRPQTV